jgi:glycine dehydrogenase subunit 1
MSFVPHSKADRQTMLRTIGAASEDELLADVPEKLRVNRPLDLPPALSEWEAVRALQELAGESRHLTCFAGAGYYDHHVPALFFNDTATTEIYTAIDL